MRITIKNLEEQIKSLNANKALIDTLTRYYMTRVNAEIKSARLALGCDYTGYKIMLVNPSHTSAKMLASALTAREAHEALRMMVLSANWLEYALETK